MLAQEPDFADKRRGARDQQTTSFIGSGTCSRRLIHPHAGFAWSYYGRPEDMLASAENTPGGMVAEPSTDLVSHIVRR